MNAIAVESLDDVRLAPYRDVRDADLRGRDGLFLVESEPVLRRVLASSWTVDSILVSPTRLARLRADGGLEAHAGPVYVLDDAAMSTISGYRVHGGVLASGRRPAASADAVDRVLGGLDPERDWCVVLCEGVTHVDNIGSVFRNAAAFGADAVILDATCADPLFRKAIRISMGHVFAVPWATSADWGADLERLRTRWGMTVCAAESVAGARSITEIPRSGRRGFVFGSEGRGVSSSTLASCDGVYAIPMAPGVPSLNVAVASAVLLHEVRRADGGD
ncbi:MAG: RNA methyltransferase [Phycisphaerales bacterium]|nr:RNA methyltransferase [Phycisphaerales bacterium]